MESVAIYLHFIELIFTKSLEQMVEPGVPGAPFHVVCGGAFLSTATGL